MSQVELKDAVGAARDIREGYNCAIRDDGDSYVREML